MGYTAQPFAVDLALVSQALGSKDLSLLEKIKSANLYEHYASQTEEHDFDEVLKDLIVRYIKPVDRKSTKNIFNIFRKKEGSGLDSKLDSLYGYAMLVICDTLGTHLSQDDVFYADTVWKEANQLFKQRGITINLDRMWETEKLFDIPTIKDFPVISHYSKSEIDYLLNELSKSKIIQEPSDNLSELQELLIAFQTGLQVCKDKGVEWISFLH